MNYKNYFKQRLIEAVSSPEEIQAHQRRRLDRLADRVSDSFRPYKKNDLTLNAFDRIGLLYNKIGIEGPYVGSGPFGPEPLDHVERKPITDPEKLAATKERATRELKRLRGTHPSLGQRIKRAVSTMLGTSSHY